MRLIPLKKWQPKKNSKAAMIKKMSDLNYRIPMSFVLEIDPKKSIDQALNQLDLSILTEEQLFIVRSSASGEDQEDQSMAGQFTSLLKVPKKELKKAIQTVYSTYNQQIPLDQEEIVLIQEMLAPDYSGILFTKNPITQSKEIVLEYSDGLGSEKIQEGISPERLNFRSGKFVLNEDSVPSPLFKKLCQESKRLEELLETPLDIEWAIVGKKIYWLQARPITSNKSVSLYDNTIAKNYLPGMIKPLVYDVNIPLVNGAWIDLLSQVIGSIDLTPEELAKSFYYRTYFNMGKLGGIFRQIGFREDFLEKLQGITQEELEVPFRPTLKLLRNAFKGFMFYARSQRLYGDLSMYLETYHKKTLALEVSIEEADAFQDLEHQFQLLRAHLKKGAYYKILIPLMNITKQRQYMNYVKKHNLKTGASLYAKENRQFNPNSYLSNPDLDWTDQTKLTFIKRFGHFSDNNNDFSIETWSENPRTLQTLIETATPTKESPLELSGRLKSQKFKADLGNLKVNQLSYYYNYSYALFRKLFLKWADLLVKEGKLIDQETIFYLSYNQLKALTKGQMTSEESRKIIDAVLHDFKRYAAIQLPNKIYGEEDPMIIDHTIKRRRYSGIPVSTGRVQGRIIKISSINEYERIEKGTIVAIPHSDMSFEPILYKARALLIESGGILSHIGILSREKSIPTITSVEDLMTIEDNAYVSIDSYIGEILVLEEST